ncbi:tetratricopeptide repeat protein [Saccharothrix isguenensis]
MTRAVAADYEGLDPLGRMLFRLLGVQPVDSFSFSMLLALAAPSQERLASVDDVDVAEEQWLDPAGRSRSRRAAQVRRVLDDLVTAHLLTRHPLQNPTAEGDTTDSIGVTGPVWKIDAVRHHLARHLAVTTDPQDVRLASLVRVVDVALWPGLHAADTLVTPYRRRTPYPAATDSLSGQSVIFSDRAEALAWLECNVDTIAAYARALHAVGEHRRSWHLVDALWPLWLHHKHYARRLELDALALRAARAWGDEAAQAEMLRRIGLAQTSLRAFDEAVEALKAALALRLRLRDRWGEADCRNALGLYHKALGNIDHAGMQFRLAARQYQAVGALREQALTNHNLGALYLDAGQPHLAQVQLSRTLDEFAALPEPDEYNALRTRVDLARAHLGMGQYEHARVLVVESVDGLARLGNVVERARAMEVLADIAQATDDPAFRRRLVDALALYRSVDSPDADRVRARLAAIRPHRPGVHGSPDSAEESQPERP